MSSQKDTRIKVVDNETGEVGSIDLAKGVEFIDQGIFSPITDEQYNFRKNVQSKKQEIAGNLLPNLKSYPIALSRAFLGGYIPGGDDLMRATLDSPATAVEAQASLEQNPKTAFVGSLLGYGLSPVAKAAGLASKAIGAGVETLLPATASKLIPAAAELVTQSVASSTPYAAVEAFKRAQQNPKLAAQGRIAQDGSFVTDVGNALKWDAIISGSAGAVKAGAKGVAKGYDKTKQSIFNKLRKNVADPEGYGGRVTQSFNMPAEQELMIDAGANIGTPGGMDFRKHVLSLDQYDNEVAKNDAVIGIHGSMQDLADKADKVVEDAYQEVLEDAAYQLDNTPNKYGHIEDTLPKVKVAFQNIEENLITAAKQRDRIQKYGSSADSYFKKVRSALFGDNPKLIKKEAAQLMPQLDRIIATESDPDAALAAVNGYLKNIAASEEKVTASKLVNLIDGMQAAEGATATDILDRVRNKLDVSRNGGDIERRASEAIDNMTPGETLLYLREKSKQLNKVKRSVLGQKNPHDNPEAFAFGRYVDNLRKQIEAQQEKLLPGYSQHINKNYAQLSDARDSLTKLFMTGPKNAKEWDSAKTNTYVNQLGRGRGDRRDNAFLNYIAGVEDMANGVRDLRRDNLLGQSIAPQKARNSAQRALEIKNAAEEEIRKIDVVVNQFPKAKDGLGKKDLSRLSRDVIAGQVGTAIGGPLGFVAGALSSDLAQSNISRLSPTRNIREQIENIYEYEKLFKNLDGLGVKFLNVGNKVKKVAPAVNLVKRTLINQNIRGTELENIRGTLEELAQMPSETDDELGAATLQQSRDVAAALATRLPKNPNEMTPFSQLEWSPDKGEIAKWNMYADAATNPYGVLDYMDENKLTLQHVEALRDLYPDLYDTLKANITAQMTDPTLRIPYNKRLQLSIFFGQPFDASLKPGYLKAMQSQATKQKEKESQKLDVKKAPDAVMTESERLSQ